MPATRSPRTSPQRQALFHVACPSCPTRPLRSFLATQPDPTQVGYRAVALRGSPACRARPCRRRQRLVSRGYRCGGRRCSHRRRQAGIPAAAAPPLAGACMPLCHAAQCFLSMHSLPTLPARRPIPCGNPTPRPAARWRRSAWPWPGRHALQTTSVSISSRGWMAAAEAALQSARSKLRQAPGRLSSPR